VRRRGLRRIVLSTFGCMFAPRHAVAAHEIARVLRPGGRMRICSWTPDGTTGQFFREIGRYLPPPSPLSEPPTLWGVESHVAQLFRRQPGSSSSSSARSSRAPHFDSAEEAVEYMTNEVRPAPCSRAATPETSGRWP